MLEDRPPKLDPDAIALSVILPIHDEEKNLQPLITEIAKALDGKVGTYEIICVDDGSRDASWKMLKQLKATHPQLVLLKFRRNFGQTAAMQAGLDHARGSTIALMDADMQNDPADIPSMVAELRAKDLDLLAGWRKQRQDFWLSRRLPSRIANWLIGKTTGVRLHDYGCTLKVLDRGLAKELRLYGEMHRFIPALAKWIGANIDERVVNHRERLHGQSKYGIGRVSRVLLDLALVLFQRTYAAKPMQIFGKWGGIFTGLGLVTLSWLTIDKLYLGHPLADRPLLILGVLFVILGIQLFAIGIIGDLLSRIYFESQGRKPYFIREKIGDAEPEAT